MNQYKIENVKDRCVCAYVTNGNVCGVSHRNTTYQLCKKHRVQLEKSLGIYEPQPVMHVVKPKVEALVAQRSSQVLKIPKGAQEMTFTIHFD